MSFHQILSSGAPTGWSSVINVIEQAGTARDYAHESGVLHCDIKPANLLVAERGAVKICDFRIAKTVGSGTASHTAFRMGTPTYMSAEHIKGDELDGRSDQYSLAAMAYVALTGSPPFQHERPEGLLFKIVMDPAPRADKLRPRVYEHLSAGGSLTHGGSCHRSMSNTRDHRRLL